ncbi:hypothetical protein SBA2_470033 [Acidobacteriia bacterium SbA2]|nr:hypothetical protein SBA2_470033 [Acidobacteriia bacterium SbA2]
MQYTPKRTKHRGGREAGSARAGADLSFKLAFETVVGIVNSRQSTYGLSCFSREQSENVYENKG